MRLKRKIKVSVYRQYFLIALHKIIYEIFMIERIREILDKEASAIRNIPVTTKFGDAIGIIYRQVHGKNGKLVTSGMGKAGQIAHNIATTFSSTGTPAAFLHPSEAQHGDLGILQANDVLLAISNSGKTREIIELIDLKNNLYPLIPLIVITGNEESPLAQKADCFISTGAPEEVCPLGLTPTTSTTVMTVIGDALVVLLMEKIGFSANDYSKRHHGGYLGIKSREISGID
jgi:arabinose-5-phosphate isomerase